MTNTMNMPIDVILDALVKGTNNNSDDVKHLSKRIDEQQKEIELLKSKRIDEQQKEIELLKQHIKQHAKRMDEQLALTTLL